nr:MAG TPA: hypothetical protein [Caudoviricetes sp.]
MIGFTLRSGFASGLQCGNVWSTAVITNIFSE